jgi:putative endonuclease
VPAKDMFYYVYILRNESGRLYIGYSEDVERRVADHNAGKVFATKPYIPYKLIFYEAYTSMVDAKRREMYLKTTKGRTTIKTMLSETLK